VSDRDELNGTTDKMEKVYNSLTAITQTQNAFDTKFTFVTEKLLDLNKNQHDSLETIAKQLRLMRRDNSKAYDRKGVSDKVFITLAVIVGFVLVLIAFRNSTNDFSAEYGKAKASVTHHDKTAK